jgi:hypothetical protein
MLGRASSIFSIFSLSCCSDDTCSHAGAQCKPLTQPARHSRRGVHGVRSYWRVVSRKWHTMSRALMWRHAITVWRHDFGMCCHAVAAWRHIIGGQSPTILTLCPVQPAHGGACWSHHFPRAIIIHCTMQHARRAFTHDTLTHKLHTPARWCPSLR